MTHKSTSSASVNSKNVFLVCNPLKNIFVIISNIFGDMSYLYKVQCKRFFLKKSNAEFNHC